MGTFRLVFAVTALVGLLAVPAPQEAYPGQSSHAAPPEGWMCQPQHPSGFGVPLDHVCGCARMVLKDPDGQCSRLPDGALRVTEDPKCTVFCHADHCACPMQGCEDGS